MKCPLSMPTVGIYGEQVFSEPRDCLENKCAWWSMDCKVCSITALASDIGFIAGALANMENKMPHEEQFRK